MLGLVAFVELVAVGVALALRSQGSAEPVVLERVVTEYVPVSVPAAAPSTPVASEIAEREPAPAPVQPPSNLPKPFTNEEEILGLPSVPAPAKPVLNTPFIADPVVERLVEEAREARVRDDIGAAIVKLEEAQQHQVDEPNVLYLFAEIFEAVGNYDQAADYYEKVFAQGPKKAGSLYELAAHKLSHGFEEARSMQGHMTLGRVRQFNDKRVAEGEKVILTIPIMSAPGREIDPNLVKVDVFFFDKLNDEVHDASAASTRESRWLTDPVDWKGNGEELLQVTYFIPPGNQRDRHLLGERKYFGQVVELHYDDELLDHQAWPRTLALQRDVPESDPLFIPEDFPVEDWNEGNPLLPPLPQP